MLKTLTIFLLLSGLFYWGLVPRKNSSDRNQDRQTGKLSSRCSEDLYMDDRIKKSDTEWQSLLTPRQYYITRQKGTELAFSGQYYENTEDGQYLCVCCGSALFSSVTKYDSGSGWPSFWAPVDDKAIEEHRDLSLGMVRTEITCRRCGAHLGHVFNDGPQPSGLRYCVNSTSLKFVKKD